jgi:hypothetical protein
LVAQERRRYADGQDLPRLNAERLVQHSGGGLVTNHQAGTETARQTR